MRPTPLRFDGPPALSVLPSYPTPALAIAPASSKSSSGKGSIFAVHTVVLAAECVKLPLSCSRAPRQPGPPLRCRSSRSRSPLARRACSYSSRRSFRFSFVSSDSASAASAIVAASPPSHLHSVAAHHGASRYGNIATLLEYAVHVKELWQDMVGVYGALLRDVLGLAWEVVLGGMNVVAQ
ncbi:hypothetical protein K438DRAFT_2020726 [Mycena galopus ATCC 62051]|nr:hypothetical protein K438DRAFT_2020726 [Mycena galopus ATCC 62051]